MGLSGKSIGANQIPASLEKVRKDHILASLQYLQEDCNESVALFEKILREVKNKTFTVLCTNAVSKEPIKIGTFTVEQTLNPIKENLFSAADLIYENYMGRKRRGYTDDKLLEAAFQISPSLTGKFTLAPELAKKNNVTATYDLHLYGSVKKDTFSDYKDSGELYGFEAKDDSGLPSGLLKELKRRFPFLRVVLINEEKATELKAKADLERALLQAKQNLITHCDTGSVKTLFQYLQQECFSQVKKVVREGDIYTINKGDREIGQMNIKKIEENSLDLSDENLTQIIKEVNQSGFNHLRKSIHTFAKEEIGCLVHAGFIPTGSAVSIPVTFLIAHCPEKGQQIPGVISNDGKLIIEYTLLTTNNSDEQKKHLHELTSNKCILARTS